MAKEFVRNIKETKLRGKNIEPLYTNEQNDLLSDKKHAYIRNNDYYFPLTQAILDLVASNDDGKNPVKPKLNIDGKENTATLEWDTKALGNNFVEQTPITIAVDDEFNQIKIGIDDEALYRFIKPYFTSSKDITVDFDDEKQTISYRLNDEAFFERLVSHFKDGNGLDFVIDNEFKTVHYNLKDDKIKSIIFETVEPKDDDLAVEQKDGKLLIDLSDKNTKLLKDHTESIKTLKTRVEKAMQNIAAIGNELGRNAQSPETTSSAIEELKTRVDNAMKNIAALSGEVNRKAQSGENSSSEIETLKTSVEKAMQNIAAISSEINKNTEKINFHKELLDQHTGEIEQHTSDINNLKIGEKSIDDDIKAIQDQLTKNKELPENISSDIEKLQTDVGRHDETINGIIKDLTDIDIIYPFEKVIEKYDFQAVTETDLSQYRKDYKEIFGDDITPLFYELRILDVPEVQSETFIFVTDNNYDETFIGNISKSVKQGNYANLLNIKLDYVNLYLKHLSNLKISPEGNGFITKFNLSDTQGVIYDLFTINSLERF